MIFFAKNSCNIGKRGTFAADLSPVGGKYYGPPPYKMRWLIFYVMEKQRVIAYIDGFNFYFGLRSEPRWKRYYWLDVVKFFDMFMKDNQELVAVKYFSARPYDNAKKLNQNAFLLPDVVHLAQANFDLHIPIKWKQYQNPKLQID